MFSFFFSFPFSSWRRTRTSLLGFTSWHKWWASLLNALQLWLWAACIVRRTNEGSNLPGGSCIQPWLPVAGDLNFSHRSASLTWKFFTRPDVTTKCPSPVADVNNCVTWRSSSVTAGVVSRKGKKKSWAGGGQILRSYGFLCLQYVVVLSDSPFFFF